jgi:L-rhamnose mutarotase
MQRLYFALDLDDDPAAIAAYENWHRPDRIWPQIVSQLRAGGVHELEVFRCGNRLVMVKQVPDELPDQGPANHEDTKTAEWEQLMWQFQRPLPFANSGQKWVPMARLFSLRQTLGEDES